MIFTSFLLGALGAFSPQQAEFSFEDVTEDSIEICHKSEL